MTGKEVIKFIKDEGIQIVDLKFVDMPGLWQHFSVSAREFEEDAFTEGVGFDGSSIRGFQAINESDMLLIPDADSMFVESIRTFQGERRNRSRGMYGSSCWGGIAVAR